MKKNIVLEFLGFGAIVIAVLMPFFDTEFAILGSTIVLYSLSMRHRKNN